MLSDGDSYIMSGGTIFNVCIMILGNLVTLKLIYLFSVV